MVTHLHQHVQRVEAVDLVAQSNETVELRLDALEDFIHHVFPENRQKVGGGGGGGGNVKMSGPRIMKKISAAAKNLQVLTLMTKSVCVQHTDVFWMSWVHLIPLFQAEGTQNIMTHKHLLMWRYMIIELKTCHVCCSCYVALSVETNSPFSYANSSTASHIKRRNVALLDLFPISDQIFTWARGGVTVGGCCSLKNLLMKSCSARHRGSSSLRTCSNICKKRCMHVISPSTWQEHALLYLWQGHLVKLGPVGHIQVWGRHVAHVQQWRWLGTPAVGALHCQLVQAWGRACQLPRAAVEACHSATNTAGVQCDTLTVN